MLLEAKSCSKKLSLANRLSLQANLRSRRPEPRSRSFLVEPEPELFSNFGWSRSRTWF